ncbi:NTP transferase domain-containing protein [Hoeflea sp. TYP-13]|uniref:nucleotidyltransferase family protein n=1 Tax=Hoeflea sp. TYP-13 TaxID=3230023 RepID=UPI0034C697D7
MTAATRNIDAVLLAAGLSRRMGDENKLLLPFGGEPLVRHTATMLMNAGFRQVVVVTGHDAREVEAALDGLDLSVSFNPHFASGQMSSVVHGLHALKEREVPAKGVMIALADMPYLQTSDYCDLSRMFFSSGADFIIVPEYLDQRGNPVILPQSQIAAATSGGLNTGCRKLIGNHPERVRAVAVNNSAFVRDIDTAADYGRALKSAFPTAPCCG